LPSRWKSCLLATRDRERKALPMTPDASRPDSAPTMIVVAPRQTVHWFIAGLLAIIATCLIIREGGMPGGAVYAQNSTMLGARGLFAFTGQLDKDKYGLWMMDVDAGTVWCYEYNAVKKKMKLVAGRTFRWDRYLENHQQDDPTPE